ncbi:sugar phosphate isomerase/epimerase family protein [Spirosoma sp. KUDC1026]|uniref:sugar phosphate isomerase/epimerase family protein n=1 Tax=Spirosoma sp. KUDC1026 TaxID=2745947 RepID=UPI00159BE862|nr:sugar phosphate isomerase/epimerase [Spirosoma sp. KUDC1026]QKZ12568.1 sugar phosphate isomerase/epimerase [Spirosoma sp. KUDC1026]
MKTPVALFVCLLCLLINARAQRPAPVGLQLYSFRTQFEKDVPGTMAKVKAMGFREVEVAGTYGLSPADFRKLLDQNGIKAISTGASFEELENNVPGIIEQAKALGVKYVTCAWIPHPGDTFTIYNANDAVDVFNTAGRLLDDNDIKLCYHTHGYEFQPYENGTFFDYLVANLNPKYVNFEMDVYWVKSTGLDPVALLKKYPRRFTLMHLKDRKSGTPDTKTGRADVESNVPLGQGDVGIAAILKQARKTSVKHYFIEDESSRSMEQVPVSLEFLEQVK